MRTVILSTLLILATLVACNLSGGDNGGGSVDIDEDDTGEGEGEAGGEGEGEGELPICDGGLCPDAGVEGFEYVGVEEDGVKCNGTPCPVGESCCVNLVGPSVCSTGGGTCPGTPLAVIVCDGPEDCGDNEECCVSFQTYSSSCVSAGSCAEDDIDDNGTIDNSTICVNSAGCEEAQLCCAVDVGIPLPVDLGGCTDEANQCQVQ